MSRFDDLKPVQFNRRSLIGGAIAAAGAVMSADVAFAQSAAFQTWVARFRAQAVGRGVSEAVYDRVMNNVKPDTAVYELQRRQPEFTEEMWQYINRRCSDWRVTTGKERAKEYASTLARVEKQYGVDRYALLGLWGMESSFGDVIENPKYMRQIIPALAALAYGEPRRRKYWEAELINALKIVQNGWAQPSTMIGSWAGAMGHTQWMPEVWLNIGVDFDGDGRINPFGKPDDALAGTARYLVERGKWRRGEAWGCEVKLPADGQRFADNRTMRSYATWQGQGFKRADGDAFKRPDDQVKLWIPVAGGPAFLVGQNFRAVYSYNPSNAYALALVHLGDLVRGDADFVQQFPGGERIPTLDEIKEIQRRLNEHGFKTDGVDGRTGSDTVRAIGAFQKSVGMKPDGYAGLKVLARLRQP